MTRSSSSSASIHSQAPTSAAACASKVRMAISDKGKGKSGGARVITYTVEVDERSGVVTLLTIYDKNEQESISRKDIDSLLAEIG